MFGFGTFRVMAYGWNVFMIDYAMPDSNLYAADARGRGMPFNVGIKLLVRNNSSLISQLHTYTIFNK